MRSLYWFLLGMWEFRLICTANAGEYIETYDWGREIAHRLTLRYFEP